MTGKNKEKLRQQRAETNHSNYLRNKARGFTDHQTKKQNKKTA